MGRWRKSALAYLSMTSYFGSLFSMLQAEPRLDNIVKRSPPAVPVPLAGYGAAAQPFTLFSIRLCRPQGKPSNPQKCTHCRKALDLISRASNTLFTWPLSRAQRHALFLTGLDRIAGALS